MKKIKNFIFFLVNEIPKDISLIESKPNNRYKFNAKRSFVSNYEKERINVKLNDKLFNKKLKMKKKLLIMIKLGIIIINHL